MTNVYNSPSQLIWEDNMLAGYTWKMTYDDAGNMLTRKQYDYTTGTLGSVRSTQTYTYGESNWGDRLKSINGTAVTSDVIGNITNDGTWSYIWKNGRQLGGMAKSGTSWLFYYDASGMRTQRTGNGTTYNYTYDGTTLSRMTVGSNTLEFAYGADGLPMAVKYNSTYYYYVTNALGDVTAILNANGAEVVSYTYDAWGNLTRVLNNLPDNDELLATYNPFRYRSYVYDQETGLYYLQSRYYSPKLCRFISADVYTSTGQGVLGNNMFVYCNNNPLLMRDPTGELGIVALMLIGAVAGAGVEYAGQVIKNHKAGLTGAEAWTPSNYGALASSAFSGALSAIPGAGSFLATAADIVGSAVIEQGVNSLCYGTTWSWSKLKKDIIGNIGSEYISKKFKFVEDVPQYLRHIKAEARELGIKGTRKLTEFLNVKQVVGIVKNSFNSATLNELIPW